MNPYQKTSNNYQHLELEAKVAKASPHELIEMLFQGAKTEISSAKVKMQHHRIAEKGAHISKAIDIVEGLRVSLDQKQGGDIAVKLDSLYSYIKDVLFEANRQNDVKKLDECYQHLDNIASAWSSIKMPTEA